MKVHIRVEHSPTGEREDRRFRCGGTIDLSVSGYQYITDELAVYVDAEAPCPCGLPEDSSLHTMTTEQCDAFDPLQGCKAPIDHHPYGHPN